MKQGRGEGTPEGDVGSWRTGDQVERDTREMTRQRNALTQGRSHDGFQNYATPIVQERRQDVEGATLFEVVDDTAQRGRLPERITEAPQEGLRLRDRLSRFNRKPAGIPVRRGTLLVRRSIEGTDAFDALVTALGTPTPAVDGEVLVFTDRSKSGKDLLDLARQTRASGEDASLDHIVPLAVVCKGEGGPARTELETKIDPTSAPRKGDAVVLAIIDTGVAPADQGHVWQSSLVGPDNTDPLHAFSEPVLDTAGKPEVDANGEVVRYLDAAAGHGAFAVGLAQQVNPGGAITAHLAIDSDGVGSDVRVAEELLKAARAGAKVINLSLGTQTLDDVPLLAIQVALEILARDPETADVLVIAAAGNFGDDRPCWPAAFKQVVAVGGLSADLEPAVWSSRGTWVDVSTVGEGLVSTYVRGTESPEFAPGMTQDAWPEGDDRPWAVWTGTSFAAPQVAAAVSKALEEAGPGAAPRQVLADLLRGARHIPGFGAVLPLLGGTPPR